VRYDFTYVQALQAKARRERSEAMFEMLIAPLISLLVGSRKQKRVTHAPRPRLARQG
jgi:hypothetical protein